MNETYQVIAVTKNGKIFTSIELTTNIDVWNEYKTFCYMMHCLGGGNVRIVRGGKIVRKSVDFDV